MDGDGNNKHDNDFVRVADFFGTFRCRRIRLHRGVPPLPPPPLPPDKTVVWTRIYRCVFDDSENALVWTGPKGMEITKILG